MRVGPSLASKLYIGIPSGATVGVKWSWKDGAKAQPASAAVPFGMYVFGHNCFVLN
jgi:hypothetical protein